MPEDLEHFVIVSSFTLWTCRLREEVEAYNISVIYVYM